MWIMLGAFILQVAASADECFGGAMDPVIICPRQMRRIKPVCRWNRFDVKNLIGYLNPAFRLATQGGELCL